MTSAPEQIETLKTGAKESDHRKFMRRANEHYTLSCETRGALRCGLSDAAHLADCIGKDIAEEHRGRNGSGKVTKQGLALQAVAKRIGDAIWYAFGLLLPMGLNRAWSRLWSGNVSGLDAPTSRDNPRV